MELFVSMEAHRATYEQQLAVARAAERLGFGGVFRSDHFLGWAPSASPGSPTEVWTTLAGLSRETRRVRLGSLLSAAPFRSPALLATVVAQLDEMSGGRVELGLGAGWFAREHHAMGVPFRSPAERFAALEEQLAIIRGLWEASAQRPFGFAGAHHRLQANPGPRTGSGRPRPRITVGGRGRVRTPRIAARFADEHNLARPSPEAAAAAIARGRAECRAIGRDPASLRHSALLRVCCGTTEDQARERAARAGAGRAPGTVTGTPSQVVAELAGYAALGVSRVYCQLVDLADLAHLELLASAVLPEVEAMTGPRA
ncbi:LLM class flavin-dependent oxidoreductase [Actinacidiphila sp. bgisy144]|uniref:LLM class flavin-dependent oxidoreductase n=1 Tax=unclassified Actinacidiphila TaxID=2995708 RepID=UPI003EBDA229